MSTKHKKSRKTKGKKKRWIDNWMIYAGILLIVGGLASVWVTLHRNLPSPFDIVDGSVSDNSSLPIIVPADANGQAGSMQGVAPTVIARDGQQGLVSSDTDLVGSTPDRLVIPIIHLDAPIISVGFKEIKVNNKVYYQWLVPDHFAAGWQNTSALLGVPGNTVFNGHHNSDGMVFKDLANLAIGDEIRVYSNTREFRYQVVEKLLLPERYASLETRMENARWIATSTDERLTLITCWPPDSNTYRVVIVAFPSTNPEPSLIPSKTPSTTPRRTPTISPSVTP
jgi:LPXTG-site transpeptidase (sortase) family protein